MCHDNAQQKNLKGFTSADLLDIIRRRDHETIRRIQAILQDQSSAGGEKGYDDGIPQMIGMEDVLPTVKNLSN
jgi:hypothetical protein